MIGSDADPASTPGRPAAPRRNTLAPPVFVLGLLFFLAAVETGSVFLAARPPASTSDWERASAHLRTRFRKGDLLTIAPSWLDPVGRLHLGDLLDLEQMSRPDSATYERIWVVAPAGRRSPQTARAARVELKRFGGLQVSLYRQKPVQVPYDFYRSVDAAEVLLARPKARNIWRCPWDARTQRHQCGAGWNNVRQKLAEIDYRLRRCIYAHPVDHHVLSIKYTNAVFGRRLVIYAGIDNYDARLKARRAVYHRYHGRPTQRGRGPARPVGVRLVVKADGRPVGTVTKPLTDTWDRHVLDTSRWAGRRTIVTFEVSTQWAWAKPFCFYARAEK